MTSTSHGSLHLDLAKELRNGRLHGPSERKFDRKQWIEMLSSATDHDNRSLLEAGLVFDDIFASIRTASRIDSLGMNANEAVCAMIAVTNYVYVSMQTSAPYKLRAEKQATEFLVPQFLQKKIKTPSGESFTPDELTTSAGDGMKHVLGVLLRAQQSIHEPATPTKFQLTDEQFCNVWTEINLAIVYRTAETYWQDCYANGFRFQRIASDELLLSSNNPADERAKVCSVFRRTNNAAQHMLKLAELWEHSLDARQRKRASGLPVVHRVAGARLIDHIEIGFNAARISKSALSVVSELFVDNGPMRVFLDDPLPNFQGVTLRQLIHARRMLQSLSEVLVENLARLPKDTACLDVVRFAPAISAPVLVAMIAKALRVSKHQSEALCTALTFKGEPTGELWAQPLIRLGDEYQLVITCAHTARLDRLIDVWMRLGGFALSDRGASFEEHCRTQLRMIIQESPLAASAIITSNRFNFSPSKAVFEEIDMILAIGSTVVVFEAKCTICPDDAIQFANHRETIESAAKQAKRKRDVVIAHKTAFIERMKQTGHDLPTDITVLGAVLVSNEAYSGYAIGDVAIVDLSIVEQFFGNELIHLELSRRGETLLSSTEKIYANSDAAPSVLPGYLLHPPQTRAYDEALAKRAVRFPLVTSHGDAITYETHEVQLSLEGVTAKFDLQPAH